MKPTKRQRLDNRIRYYLDTYPALENYCKDLEVLRRNASLPPLDALHDQMANLLKYYGSTVSVIISRMKGGHILKRVNSEKNRRSIQRMKSKKRDALRNVHTPSEMKAILSEARAKITKSRQVSIRAGYFYAITNPTFPDWIKVGCAVDVFNRLKTYQTYDPLRRYELVYKRIVSDRRYFEKEIMKMLHDCESSGEWFQTDLENIRTRFKIIQRKLLTQPE